MLLFLVGFGGLQLYAQSKTVTGNIRSADGEALIGATVQAKNSTEGVTTDIDGNFTISVPESIQALIVSYTGYKTQEVSITAVAEV
ncbi:MAG: carboxypeptidase-like regulatory domain-containing protein, partial [Saprospiraceae bacterium]